MATPKNPKPIQAKATYTPASVYKRAKELAEAYLQEHPKSSQQQAFDLAYQQIMTDAPSKADRIIALKTYIRFGNALLYKEIDSYNKVINICLRPDVCGEFERSMSSEKVFPDNIVKLLNSRVKDGTSKQTPDFHTSHNFPSIAINGICLNYVTFIKNGLSNAFPCIVTNSRELAAKHRHNFSTVLSGLTKFQVASMETELRSISDRKTSPYNERGQRCMYLNYNSTDEFLSELCARIAYRAVNAVKVSTHWDETTNNSEDASNSTTQQ